MIEWSVLPDPTVRCIRFPLFDAGFYRSAP